MEKKENRKSKIHAGHRQRLKDKVRQNGLNVLSEHEVLELLLTYSIPLKDTNELAHKLIDNFGDITKVIDADYKELIKQKGVGEETALFLHVLSSFYDKYKLTKNYSDNETLDNTQKCVDYFRKNYEIKDSEKMYVVCLSKLCKVMKSFTYNGQDDTEITVNIKELMEKVVGNNVAGIVIFHTHPHGSVEPSLEDIYTTQKIYNTCRSMDLLLIDHIIFNTTEHYSFGSNGELAKMEKKYYEVFDDPYVKEKKKLNQNLIHKYMKF
ncbi:MAG: RadC family protein [Clostridia bacterium]|nr:RadC family protein [Clostridia bacterium]